jgi:hypothetical protein
MAPLCSSTITHLYHLLYDYANVQKLTLTFVMGGGIFFLYLFLLA